MKKYSKNKIRKSNSEIINKFVEMAENCCALGMVNIKDIYSISEILRSEIE